MKPSLPLLCLAGDVVGAVPRPETAQVRRQVSQLRNGGYDFIIAGGGTSGLTVADRLSEAFPKSKLISLPNLKSTISWSEENMTNRCNRNGTCHRIRRCRICSRDFRPPSRRLGWTRCQCHVLECHIATSPGIQEQDGSGICRSGGRRRISG